MMMPGKGVTSEPVAIRMFLAEMEEEDPSAAATLTVFLSAMLPHPLA